MHEPHRVAADFHPLPHVSLRSLHQPHPCTQERRGESPLSGPATPLHMQPSRPPAFRCLAVRAPGTETTPADATLTPAVGRATRVHTSFGGLVSYSAASGLTCAGTQCRQMVTFRNFVRMTEGLTGQLLHGTPSKEGMGRSRDPETQRRKVGQRRSRRNQKGPVRGVSRSKRASWGQTHLRQECWGQDLGVQLWVNPGDPGRPLGGGKSPLPSKVGLR